METQETTTTDNETTTGTEIRPEAGIKTEIVRKALSRVTRAERTMENGKYVGRWRIVLGNTLVTDKEFKTLAGAKRWLRKNKEEELLIIVQKLFRIWHEKEHKNK